MGMTGWMLSLYKWEKLSDQSLVEMLHKVRSAIDKMVLALPIDKPNSKDLGKAFDSEKEIMAEMDKRGIPYVKR